MYSVLNIYIFKVLITLEFLGRTWLFLRLSEIFVCSLSPETTPSSTFPVKKIVSKAFTWLTRLAHEPSIFTELTSHTRESLKKKERKKKKASCLKCSAWKRTTWVYILPWIQGFFFSFGFSLRFAYSQCKRLTGHDWMLSWSKKWTLGLKILLPSWSTLKSLVIPRVRV